MTINTFFDEAVSNVSSLVKLYVSGVGAAAADLTSVKGATLIDQTATGLYTVTLPRKFAGLLNMSWSVKSSTAANWSVQIISETVATDGKVNIAVLSAADNAATAPTKANLSTGETLFLEFTLKDSATKPAGF
jgi:hypothetical protein